MQLRDEAVKLADKTTLAEMIWMWETGGRFLQICPKLSETGSMGVLTRQLQSRVSCGVAYTRWGVSSVGHVWLWTLGFSVDHSQTQAQAFCIRLSSERQTTRTGSCTWTGNTCQRTSEGFLFTFWQLMGTSPQWWHFCNRGSDGRKEHTSMLRGDRWPSTCTSVGFHLFLDVLDQEWRGTQVVHGEAEEALDLFLMQVHGDDVS